MPTAPPSADRLGVSSTLEMADSGAGATRHTTAAPGRAATPVPRKADLSQLGPVHLQQLLHVALHKAVEVDRSIKDFIVHEGQPIWVACARGKLRLSDIITGAPDLEGPMSREAIMFFVVITLMGSETPEQVKTNQERLALHMEKRSSYSDSIRLNWGSKIRISLFRQAKGKLALVGRVSSLLVAPLDKIGLPHQAVSAIRQAQRGLVVITGPMSSGKTATAQSILNHRNFTSTGHIMTVEDPIETSLTSEKCLITCKEVGVDVGSFLEGLQDALRQAVDVLLIGELRDADTIKAAISAAGSGMLVVATVHGDTCAGALTRMMSLLGDAGAGYWKVLSATLITVIRQALVPTSDGASWQVAADALINRGTVSNTLKQADASQLETFADGPTKSDEWISMNDSLRTLVTARRVTLEHARRETTDVKALQNWAPQI